jgi:hypothetical protein
LFARQALRRPVAAGSEGNRLDDLMDQRAHGPARAPPMQIEQFPIRPMGTSSKLKETAREHDIEQSRPREFLDALHGESSNASRAPMT